MNHNPYNLKVNQWVLLDREYNNSTEVIIHSFTPDQIYAEISTDGNKEYSWQVMTNRLSPIKIYKHNLKNPKTL